MDEFEKTISTILSDTGKFNAEKAETLRREIVQMFEKKLKKVKLATQISVLALAAIIIYSFHCLWHSQNTIEMFTHAIVILILSHTGVVFKLWYWVLNTKYGVLKEIKELQLQIAELAGKNPPSDN